MTKQTKLPPNCGSWHCSCIECYKITKIPTMNNGRYCKHGSKVGKCDACEVERLDAMCSVLEVQISSFTADRNAWIATAKANAEEMWRVTAERDKLLADKAVLLDILGKVTKHFTKTPSSLKDSEIRGIAHSTLAKHGGSV